MVANAIQQKASDFSIPIPESRALSVKLKRPNSVFFNVLPLVVAHPMKSWRAIAKGEHKYAEFRETALLKRAEHFFAKGKMTLAEYYFMKCVVASNFSHKTVAKALHGLHKVSLERNELFKACRYLNRAISYDMATDKSWLEPKNLLAAAEELMSGMNCLKAEREPLMQKITRILEGMGAGTQIALSEKRRLIALDVSGLIFDATFELDKKDYPNEYKESVRKKAGELTDKLEKLMPLQKSIS